MNHPLGGVTGPRRSVGAAAIRATRGPRRLAYLVPLLASLAQAHCAPSATPEADASPRASNDAAPRAGDAALPAVDAAVPASDVAVPARDASGSDVASASCASPGVQSIDDTAIGSGDGQITYGGTWETSTGAPRYMNDDHYTHDATATAQMAFTGTRVTLYSARAPQHGIAAVSVDDGAETDVDLYAATRTDDVAVFTSPVLELGRHTLHVRATGRSNPAASDSVIQIDQVDVATCDRTTSTDAGTSSDAASPDASVSADGGGYLTRSGTALSFEGRPYRFAGLDADTWFGCWTGEVPTDAELERYFSQLNPRSMTRIWPMAGSDLSIMDRIVAAAARHHQLLAATLFNGNADCSALPPPSYTPGTNAEELAWIHTIVPRYRDSTAIGFWEIINEPNGGNPDLRGFYREMSDAIRGLDPNHLIGSGSHAAWSSGTVANYIDQHNVPNIDLISMHEYDAATGLSGWASAAEMASMTLNKPWYVGEDGFCCGGGDTGSNAANAAKLDLEWQAYLAAPGCAGMMYWDFKLGYAGSATVNFDTPMWTEAQNFRDVYNR